ncbi:four helix bundle protein [Candidatus Uhrbacteria bacterium]|nr:four helix bundle protein [Candidatus Uhrbacteria bacterium]
MSIKSFTDILAWKKSRILAKEIYVSFSKSRDFGFRDQIQRASVSVMNNIAEGFGRRGNKEFAYHLRVAKGSCLEVQSMLFLALDLGYIDTNRFDELMLISVQVHQLINAFISSIKD